MRVLCPNEFATHFATKYIPFSIVNALEFYFDRLMPYVARGIFCGKFLLLYNQNFQNLEYFFKYLSIMSFADIFILSGFI